MSPLPTDPNEQQLTRLLQEWKITAPLPLRFEQNVWLRIARGEQQEVLSWAANWLARLQAALSRPALVGSYLMLLLLTGLATGYIQARQVNTHLRDSLEARYVQSVDPYYRLAHK